MELEREYIRCEDLCNESGMEVEWKQNASKPVEWKYNGIRDLEWKYNGIRMEL